MPFPFENLTVYQSSLDFIEAIDDLLKEMKGKVAYTWIDQLGRASASIPLNIAESGGRWFSKDKAQFLRIARGSVFEIVPIIQVLYRKQVIPESRYKTFYDHLSSLARMLTALIRSIEKVN